MHTWTWQSWQGKPFLTCSLLDSWPHGFFTRQWYPELPAALTQALSARAVSYRVRQVHGSTILTSSDIKLPVVEPAGGNESRSERPPADGLLSEQPGQAMWVCTADCTPVLIGDRATGQVVAIHAGWRGTAQNIVPTAISKLQARGSRVQDLRMAVGPAISGDVYQVEQEVAIAVGKTVMSGSANAPAETVMARLRQAQNSPVLDDPEPGRVRLDVRRINQMQAIQAGILPEQIAIAPYCTYQQPEHFFSYRRTGERQVQWSGIVSR
ncbi:peptidoglycan editing factor PgeF [Romeria aff. gracilis LEGE 07310]|uniref:Purine nucleoside phosphorylase n=1 Tax=Vasconcelosia minhoensis LEGE 07310 TaxID=915328 RepID=A0A8J7DS90_9CYAN|nr:peptidoglycan editing factor PgeF [Romeria gracilis]MBE9079819.1 peptidoglycan editing factor PgeF [Romeria aff. gracilis LEGE 07310]